MHILRINVCQFITDVQKVTATIKQNIYTKKYSFPSARQHFFLSEHLKMAATVFKRSFTSLSHLYSSVSETCCKHCGRDSCRMARAYTDH